MGGGGLRILVWVIFLAELPISGFDLLVGCLSVYAEDLRTVSCEIMVSQKSLELQDMFVPCRSPQRKSPAGRKLGRPAEMILSPGTASCRYKKQKLENVERRDATNTSGGGVHSDGADK